MFFDDRSKISISIYKISKHLICLYFLDKDFVVNFEIYINFIDKASSTLGPSSLLHGS